MYTNPVCGPHSAGLMILNTELSALLTILNVFVYNVHLNCLGTQRMDKIIRLPKKIRKKKKLKKK